MCLSEQWGRALPAKRSKLPFIIPAVIGILGLIGLLGVGVAVYVARSKGEQATGAEAARGGVPTPLVVAPSPTEALPPVPAFPAIAAASGIAPRATAEQTWPLPATRAEPAGATAPEAAGAESAGAPQAEPEAPPPPAPELQAEPEPVAPEREHAASITTPLDPLPSSLVAIAAAPPDLPALAEETAASTDPPAPPIADQPPASSDGVRPERVFVHHRAGSPTALRAAEAAAAAAREAGLPVMELRTVPTTPAIPEVRFFHAADSEAAARLARQLGPAWRVRDFRHYTPPPHAGTLEIWVPSG